MKPLDDWLRTNQLTDSVESLEMTLQVASDVSKGQTQQWKWLIVSLHNALQGFLVCSLFAGNPVNVLVEKHAKEWIEAANNGKPLPKRRRLLHFKALLRNAEDGSLMMKIGRKPLCLDKEQRLSVLGLHKYRNELVHFLPMSRSIDARGLPEIATHCVEVIKFLALDSGNTVWMDRDLQLRCETAGECLLVLLGQLDRRYNRLEPDQLIRQ